MMESLRQVLQHPHSITARRQLARDWRAIHDPRADLIEKQLKLHDTIGDILDLSREARLLVKAHGREWAGGIADIATEYRYELGLVAEVTLPGDVFLQRAREMVEIAPIVHLNLEGPVDVAKLARIAALRQISTLRVAAGPWIDDVGAEALAASEYAKRLRIIDLSGGQITSRGMGALTRSPNLRDVVYIDLTKNPVQDELNDFGGTQIEDGYFWINGLGQKYLAGAHRAAVASYDPMKLIHWPPPPEMFAYVK